MDFLTLYLIDVTCICNTLIILNVQLVCHFESINQKENRDIVNKELREYGKNIYLIFRWSFLSD